ncbi:MULTISPECIES: NHL repeat-containing protein [unclassified Paenibacillus]|uniref:NHL repeat-containing protein n=1 Tax=unclassified Paenibacillus TaxID=185978 RepID=UPI0007E4A16E|nr:NHL repeat-containing protein [Paenibacillus sp. AD87]OAX48534.1 Serine/threonine-protein kinase PknD [Paenibacillus sp. AD87]
MLKKLLNKKIYLLPLLVCLISASLGGTTVSADEAPSSYNYSYWGDTAASPDAYQATIILRGETLKIGAFKNPSDVYVTSDNQIYVLDSGNNRIVLMDSAYKLIRIIDSFNHNGQQDHFSNPQGLFVTEDKQLYVADTGKQRMVHLDAHDQLVKVVENPQSELLNDNFSFQPTRLVVDKAQRIYVMSSGIFDGFMEFSSEGTFTSFIGANRVTFSPSEYLWKMLSTQAQRKQMVMFTPVEFTNIDIDDEGFLYATNGQKADNVRKLNAQGSDILRRLGYYPPEGDIRFTKVDGPTRLIDIDVTDSEIYSILDASRGRIFTYNGDGYLMYVFGGLGNQIGEFNTPVAMDRVGDDFMVIDKELGEITIFQTTQYGRTLNEAVRSYYRGEEEKAHQLFEQTVSMNSNLEFAYAGIGKALVRQGEYAEAMKYFKRSMDREGYSKAFLLYRKQVLREYFPSIMSLLLVLVISGFIWRQYRKIKRRKKVVSVE